MSEKIIQRLNAQDREIADIKNNHIHHLQIGLAEVKVDIRWIKRILIPVLLSSVGGLIAQLFK